MVAMNGSYSCTNNGAFLKKETVEIGHTYMYQSLAYLYRQKNYLCKQNLRSHGLYMHRPEICNTIQRKTFEGENFHEFRGFRATCESFSTKFGRTIPTYVRFQHSVKIFSTKWSLSPIHESFLPRKFRATLRSLFLAVIKFCEQH